MQDLIVRWSKLVNPRMPTDQVEGGFSSYFERKSPPQVRSELGPKIESFKLVENLDSFCTIPPAPIFFFVETESTSSSQHYLKPQKKTDRSFTAPEKQEKQDDYQVDRD